MPVKTCSLGTSNDESLSTIIRKHQSQRATTKQINATIGAVQQASKSHNDVRDESRRCQSGHAIGASKNSNTATAAAERSRAVRTAARASFIADFRQFSRRSLRKPIR